MHIGNSIKLALIQNGENQNWLAGEMETSAQNVSRIANQKEANSSTIEKLAEIFDMTESEFIELGDAVT